MTKSRRSRPGSNNTPSATLLIILSGPSGVGKDAILSRMKESDYPMRYVTTVTTRPKRPAETEGVDYYFVSPERFQEMIRNNELLEWAQVYNNHYGVPKAQVKQGLEEGYDVIMRIDVQGAASIKKAAPEAVFIFIVPPTIDELSVRLKQRHTESEAELATRLQAATREMEQLPMFDYVIENRQDEIDLAVSDIKSIITAEKCRVHQRKVVL